MKNVVAIISGGMDSITMLYKLLDDGMHIEALGFDYGQRHARELMSAETICRKLGVTHNVVNLKGIAPLIAGESALLNRGVDVPDGHYEAPTMKQTVVPNRNMIMLSVAAGVAIARKFDAVAYGAHAGDHAIYPDCRRGFAEAIQEVLYLADWRPIELHAPFINMSKADIVKLGDSLGVPFDATWSCYKGEEKHCGTCGTCVERREAFSIAGVVDPTLYA